MSLHQVRKRRCPSPAEGATRSWSIMCSTSPSGWWTNCGRACSTRTPSWWWISSCSSLARWESHLFLNPCRLFRADRRCCATTSTYVFMINLPKVFSTVYIFILFFLFSHFIVFFSLYIKFYVYVFGLYVGRAVLHKLLDKHLKSF